VNRLRRRAAALRRRPQDGIAAIAAVMLTVTLLLVIGLVLDGGLALSGKSTAMDEAQEAARAGAQALNMAAFRATGTAVLDPQAASAAAEAYLASTGDSGTVQVDGETVTVTVTHVQHTQLLSLAGLDTITVHATAQSTAEQTS
jgi:Flp pilus assembly protein TadG